MQQTDGGILLVPVLPFSLGVKALLTSALGLEKNLRPSIILPPKKGFSKVLRVIIVTSILRGSTWWAWKLFLSASFGLG